MPRLWPWIGKRIEHFQVDIKIGNRAKEWTPGRMCVCVPGFEVGGWSPLYGHKQPWSKQYNSVMKCLPSLTRAM